MPVLLGALSFVTGCGKSDDESDKSLPKTGSVPVIKHAFTDWEPNPEWRPLMTQTVDAGPYQFSLTNEFQPVEPSRKVPESMKLFVWKGHSKDGSPPPVLTVAVWLRDPRLLGEATKDLRRLLMDFTAGNTDSMGINRSGFPALQTGPIGGIEFSRARWIGMNKDRVKVAGATYGAVDGTNLIAIIALGFGPDADASLKMLESFITSLKKK